MKRYIVYLLLLVPLFAHAHWDSAYNHEEGMQGTWVSADWMKDLLDAQSVYQVSIPGTHDSASRYGGWYVQTQSLTIPEQLRAGIRYLDIRAKATNGSLALHHGVVYQKMMFGTALGQVRDYLIAHPSEFVFMRLKEEDADDPNFAQIVKNYMDAPQYRDVIWRPRDQNVGELLKVGEVRGKIIVLGDYPGDGDADFGMRYKRFAIQDNWDVGTNWGLYGLWEKIRDQLDLSQRDGQIALINHLVGSNIAFPYFIASGHSSPENAAPRLATGFTTPGWNWKYPDFPRVSCWGCLCTIAFEGTNILTRDYIAKVNAKHEYSDYGPVNERGLLTNSPYVGIIVADFPGAGLIETVVKANRFYDFSQCFPQQGCVEYFCGEKYPSRYDPTVFFENLIRYKSRYVPGSIMPTVSYFDLNSYSWKAMGPFYGDSVNGEWRPAKEYYKRAMRSGAIDYYTRNSTVQKACFVDGGDDPVWTRLGSASELNKPQPPSSTVNPTQIIGGSETTDNTAVVPATESDVTWTGDAWITSVTESGDTWTTSATEEADTWTTPSTVSGANASEGPMRSTAAMSSSDIQISTENAPDSGPVKSSSAMGVSAPPSTGVHSSQASVVGSLRAAP